MIQAQATAARMACAQMTTLHLTAALEMERHLRGLLYMWRLALTGRQATAHEAVT